MLLMPRQACRFLKQQVLCRDYLVDLVGNPSGKLSDQLYTEILLCLGLLSASK